MKQKLLGLLFAWLCVAAGMQYDAQAADPNISSIVARLENPELTSDLDLASFDHTARAIVAGSRDAQALIARKKEAAAYITRRFTLAGLGNRDYALAHYAYVIEQVGYKEALPTLNQFLKNPRSRSTMLWSIVFAEKARSALEAGQVSP